MKYTVTIKDNESGEIVSEVECNSIVGGASINEKESVSIGIVECNGAELLGACQSAKKAIHECLKGDTVLTMLFTLYEMKLLNEMRSKSEEKEDTDND